MVGCSVANVRSFLSQEAVWVRCKLLLILPGIVQLQTEAATVPFWVSDWKPTKYWVPLRVRSLFCMSNIEAAYCDCSFVVLWDHAFMIRRSRTQLLTADLKSIIHTVVATYRST